MASAERRTLEVRGLRHRFGDRVAVDDLDLIVPGGEIVGLVGRNGAGKTTTMRAIMGVVIPEAGTMTWDGHAVDPRARRTFGYMPEERGMYPQMLLLDQIAYFGTLHGMSQDDAVAAARGWLDRLGLGDRATDRIVALSHGNQQRAQLAVALVHHPPLLVLDEPFAGLDPEAVVGLSTILRELAAGGAGVLLSSHQLDLVEHLCHRVVIVESGRVLAAGTLTELRARVPARLRVHVDGSYDWVARLPGVRLEGQDGDGVLLRLAPGADVQSVMRAAQSAGAVDHFAFEEGTLTELFHLLVTS